METTRPHRTFIAELTKTPNEPVKLRGWVARLRVLSGTTFVVLRDCSGELQCVGGTDQLKDLHLKVEDAIEVTGCLRPDERAKGGVELDIAALRVLGAATNKLPFGSAGNIQAVSQDVRLEYRPLSARNPWVGDVFRLQARVLELFRDFLRSRRFTEIVTSKIVASGTEGGTQLFAIDYFGRSAFLAQSPQFYKEHGVAGFERVFETGHVYRAEPHASARHLTEYCSLDLEMGFIDGPEDVIALERELLTQMFESLNREASELFTRRGLKQLPSMLEVPTWEFAECLERLARTGERGTAPGLEDDLDPEAERRLCALAESDCGVPAVFVIGFPLDSRPFYTAPRGGGAAQSFDLLFRGLEITTGGQRLHRRDELETALRGRGLDPSAFESHLRMFELGMPPHGGLAIGLERLTAQVLGLGNVRDAVLYPRDRYRVTP
jgi:nondiscriminating aspartyl-tRNA synthetase